MSVKVIKHGKKETTKVIYIINCPNCGCEFECETEDFTAFERTPNGRKFLRCPDCGEEITVNSETKYREEKVTADDYKGPRCPKCGSTHYRTSGVGTATCLGWYPEYKDGKLLNENPNKTTMVAECCECGAKFNIVN